MCVSALDKRQPDWQFISEYPSTDTIAALLAEMFPELLKSQAKKTTHSSSRSRSTLNLFPVLVLAGAGFIVISIWNLMTRDNSSQPAANSALTSSVINAPLENTTSGVDGPPTSGPLVSMRVWTHRDGRKLEATLVSVAKTEEGQYEGTFLRPSGDKFTFIISNLRNEDVVVVNTVMRERGILVQ